MIEGLFDLKINNGDNIAISNNEIYNQLLLYLFFSLKKNIVLVYPSLSDANNAYSELGKYLNNNLFIFPDDDYLTKKAIAVSPELQYMRVKFLNGLENTDKKVLICHTNSFLKKLPSKSNYLKKVLEINKNDLFEREEIVKKLSSIGYKRESIVTSTGEFSVRGFVIDVFPFFEEHPIRIEFFDNVVESIKSFDENTQLSKKEISKVSIKPIIDEYDDNASSVLDYMDSPLVIYNDYEQITNEEKSIIEELKYYDDLNALFNLKDIKNDFCIYLDRLKNAGNYKYIIEATKIDNYNNDKTKFVYDILNNQSFLCSSDISFIKSIGINSNKVINVDINSGFIYNNIYYFSKNDLKGIKNKIVYNTGIKLGKKIDNIDNLEIGDYVVHKVNGIGIYSGICTITKNGLDKDYILIQYKGDDKLYLPVEDVDKLYKYSSKDGAKPTIYKLNSVEWQKTKMKIKQKIHDISQELIKIYKNRASSSVIPFEKDYPEQAIFENEFIYEETPDQLKATMEIKRDLESSRPMDRLLCGDVGYGKTEVIFRAIFKTVMNKKQVAYLCPTTLLSYQQFTNAMERFKNFPINIALINRYTTKKEVKELLNKLKNGGIDVIFGTHRLLSSDINFKDLGLLVIDEEQRFGVMHKEKIKEMKSNVHVLSVSATPIPRSLQMSLIGLRDMSLIETPPKSKLPVQTYVINYDIHVLREIVLKEKARNGQVFILYNRVDNMSTLVRNFEKVLPEVSIKYAHGKMNKEDMQDVVYQFNQGLFDCLVCTTIIENGIDIPNANTIIVMNADRFGLAQLYQIRGRVGRSDRQAYAYLMYDKDKILSDDAVKRLNAIKEFTQLGSGYKIAMRDLSIRGAGDLLGREQAGFIDSVGVELYLELINEELEGKTEGELPVTKIDDVSTHLGEDYSDEDSVIIEIHKQIAKTSSISDIDEVYNEIKDRFGIATETLKMYLYQSLIEKLINKLGIKILINDKYKISIKIDDNIYNNISVEKLFVEATRITSKLNFAYRSSSIIITLNKMNLDKHYIYYLFELIKLIDHLYNEK